MTGSDPQETPPLEDLCKTYFNQDWHLWGSDAAAVLDSLGGDEPLEAVVATRDAAADLLGRGLANDELQAELEAVGLDEYDPGYEGRTYREWLELVAVRLTSWIERRAPSR